MLVLEEFEHAARRGAHVYAEIDGFATSRQRLPHDRPAPPTAWRWPRRSAPRSHAARIDGDAVDYVNAHGSGTKQNDRHETAAFKRSLGPHAYGVPR